MLTRPLFIAVALAVTAGSAGALAAPAEVRVRQLTRGPANHFFGYIGQCRTIPWSADGRYLLALETTFQDRLPGAGDAAGVCLLDTRDGYRVRVVDRTRGWNPQQGTMFYWNPEHPETQFFFNDRDPVTGKIFTVLFDVSRGRGGERIREYRFADTPVGNGGVAQNGGYFLAINYARLARLRAVTGYKEAWDWTNDVGAPANDGIFRIEVATGVKTLIVSFAQLKEKLRDIDPGIEGRHLFINHTLNNRNNDRVYFYCRADFDDRDKRLNVPFTVRPDGTELTRHEIFIGGHPDWEWGNRIIGSADDKQVIYDTASRKIVSLIGGKDLFPNPGGDIALAPDGRWFVNSHRDGEHNHYTFLDRSTGRVVRSPPVFLGPWKSGDLRLDPAPCWNRSGDAIVVPGIAADGSRQMFLLELDRAAGVAQTPPTSSAGPAARD
ncbi:MAG: hypothetical protein Q7S40_00310 [Opitutaceae bacterium]|nr:hypothetical protein [Opitutaceae bacterium]